MCAHHREVVRDEQIGQPEPLLQVEHQVDDLRLDVDVERRDRLVGHDEIGLDRQRAGDRDALALAAGELVREARGPGSGQADEVEQFAAPGRAPPRRVAAHAVRDQRLGEDLADRHARIERRIGVLEDHLHAPAQRADLRRGWRG